MGVPAARSTAMAVPVRQRVLQRTKGTEVAVLNHHTTILLECRSNAAIRGNVMVVVWHSVHLLMDVTLPQQGCCAIRASSAACRARRMLAAILDSAHLQTKSRVYVVAALFTSLKRAPRNK